MCLYAAEIEYIWFDLVASEDKTVDIDAVRPSVICWRQPGFDRSAALTILLDVKEKISLKDTRELDSWGVLVLSEGINATIKTQLSMSFWAYGQTNVR